MNQPENKTSTNEHKELEKSHHSSRRLGTVTILLIFGLFGIWSVFAKIETTITASGKIITQSYNKIVMHPQGGMVNAVFVKEGELVKKDQPLLKLDSTEYVSELSSSIQKYDTNLFTICRSRAQADLQDNMECAPLEKKIIDTGHLAQLKSDSVALHQSGMKSLYAKIDLINSQNDVLQFQNDGLEKQIESNGKLLASYERELKKWNKLLKEDAIDELKSIAVQRQIEQSHLQINSLKSLIKENLATIRSNNVQISLEKTAFKNDVLKKLNEVELDNVLIFNKIKSLRNYIQNSTIKSPSDGIVTDMKIHATGEVVSPQKIIMSIVPDNKDLIIEGYVLPTDVERIYKGQSAEISFPAFVDPSALPVDGKLVYISADTITPEVGRESYYVVLIEITPEGFKAIEQNHFKIVPGMPASAFIRTGKKTLMEYILNPVVQMFKGIYNAN
jgi:epimerase transport system membrane fusion protein